jgi:hypothetical protein
MPITVNRPLKDADTVVAYTASIATTPVAAVGVVTNVGTIERVYGVAAGVTTGTITVTVSTAAGTVGTFTIAAGTNSTGTVEFGPLAQNALVNEGDIVTFTPAGGTGTTIPGLFTAVVR